MRQRLDDPVTCQTCGPRDVDYFTAEMLTRKYKRCEQCVTETLSGFESFDNDTLTLSQHRNGSTAFQQGVREAYNEYFFQMHGDDSTGEIVQQEYEAYIADLPDDQVSAIDRPFNALTYASAMTIISMLSYFGTVIVMEAMR
jgi:hypothetical protein